MEQSKTFVLPGAATIMGTGEVTVTMKCDDQGYVRITGAVSFLSRSIFLSPGQCRTLANMLQAAALDGEVIRQAADRTKAAGQVR